VEGEHEIGLLDDLLAVQVEVVEVQQERVLLRGRVLEVPDLVVGEALGLRMDAELFVPGDDHVARGVTPGRGLLQVGAESSGVTRMARDGVGCVNEVLLREQIRVDVVVGDRAVLVGTSDPVDPEASS
jgi:hypothetical protein